MREFSKRHDLLLRLLSFVLAFLLWLVVMGQEDHVRATTLNNLRITRAGVGELLRTYELSVIAVDHDSADVRVSGLAGVIGDSRLRDSMSVSVDFSGCVTPGEYDLPLRVSAGRTDVDVVRVQPETIHIRVDKLETKSIPVKVTGTSSVAASGYRAGTPTPAVDSVTVEGPAADIREVTTAYLFFESTGQTSTLREDCAVVLCNELGDPITSPYVKSQTSTVNVLLPISKINTLPLSVTLKDDGTGLRERAVVEITPKTVDVVGDQNAYAQMSEISLGEIDLGSVRTGIPLSMPIELPDGVRLDTGQPSSAKVTITFEGIATRMVEVSKFVPVDTAQSNALTATVLTEKVEIEMRGSEQALDQVDTSSFTVSVTYDSSSLGQGSHKVRGMIAATGLPEGVYLVDQGVQIDILLTPS